MYLFQYIFCTYYLLYVSFQVSASSHTYFYLDFIGNIEQSIDNMSFCFTILSEFPVGIYLSSKLTRETLEQSVKSVQS